jgi:hypothetical protein
LVLGIWFLEFGYAMAKEPLGTVRLVTGEATYGGGTFAVALESVR